MIQASSAKIVSMSELKKPSIRPACFDDYDGIADVESRNGLTPKPREQWLDLWLANPAFKKLRQWPIGWVIQDHNGRIVGSLGNIPTFVYLRGSRYVASAGRGWAVDPDYRNLSIMLLAQQIKSPEADMNVVTTPGPITAALCSRLGWVPMPVGQWDRSDFWIVNYSGALRSYLAVKVPGPLGKLAASLALPVDAVNRWKESPAAVLGCVLDWPLEFDRRFDAFWEELLHQRDDLLLGARDAATLSWHFKYAIQRNKLWILAASIGSRLIGYAILERRDAAIHGLTRLVLIDLQMSPDYPQLASILIDAIRRRCLTEQIDIVENQGCWLRKLPLVHRPPHQRKLDWWGHLYRVTNPNLKIAAASWYPTQYDGDASL